MRATPRSSMGWRSPRCSVATSGILRVSRSSPALRFAHAGYDRQSLMARARRRPGGRHSAGRTQAGRGERPRRRGVQSRRRVLRAQQSLPAPRRQPVRRRDRPGWCSRPSRAITSTPARARSSAARGTPGSSTSAPGSHGAIPQRLRTRRYEVSVEQGARLVEGPYKAETFPVSVEGEYVVVEA